MAVTILGLFALAGIGNAAPPPYQPPPTVVVNVNVTIIIVNGPFIFFGDGFEPGENVIITIFYNGPSGLRSTPALAAAAESKVVSTTADSSGHFEASLNLDKVGTYTLTATGQSSARSASSTITVVGSQAETTAGTTTVPAGGGLAYTGQGSDGSAGGGLAYTGTSVAGPIAIGAAALLAGLTLLFFGTRGVIRRKGSGPASL
ncbi:hypothetical protein ACVBEQ_01545 [Nakamurella sp. GG22]